MELIGNQPIIFNQETDNCCSVISYKQLVDVGDINQFQLRLEPCQDAVDLIINGAFNDSSYWSLNNFTVSDNKACNGSSNYGYILEDPFTVGHYYKVTFTILSGTDINLIVSFGLNNQVGVYDSPGTYSVYGFALDQYLVFIEAADSDVCITDIFAYEIDINFGFAIKNSNGTIVHTEWLADYLFPVVDPLDPSGTPLSYSIVSEYFTLVNGYLTVSVNWGDFEITTNGCYTICLLDPCDQQSYNSSLCGIGGANWTVNTYLGCTLSSEEISLMIDSDLSGCGMLFTNIDGPGIATALSTISQFVPGTKYTITFSLALMSNAHFAIAIDTALSAYYDTDGTYTLDIVADGDALFLAFGVVANGAAIGFVYDVKIHVSDELLSATLCSQELKLGEFIEFGCETKQIKACNDTDAFGLVFSGTGFSPAIRLECSLDRAIYNSDRSLEVNSNARYRNTFYQRKKSKRLVFAPMPEYVHDFISLLFGFDHFYIDDVEYNVDENEEYVVNYEVDDNVGSVAFQVVIKEQLVRNTVSAAEGAGCGSNPEGLIDEATGLFTLLSENGLNILIKENQ